MIYFSKVIGDVVYVFETAETTLIKEVFGDGVSSVHFAKNFEDLKTRSVYWEGKEIRVVLTLEEFKGVK